MTQESANQLLRGWHDCKRGVALDRTRGQDYVDGWNLARLQILPSSRRRIYA